MCPAINGYMFGNLPGLSMCMGNKIHWHLLGIGNEMDVHSIHFHGQILTHLGHHVDTISLFPASFVNVVMVADNPGQWLMGSVVNDYVKGLWDRALLSKAAVNSGMSTSQTLLRLDGTMFPCFQMFYSHSLFKPLL